jgi:dolichol-phosphate mannosyltransferase
MKQLSVIVPAYNEERFIGALLEKIRAVDLSGLGISQQVIVVDDCSRDRTSAIAESLPGVIVERHQKNMGKGGAVRTGIGKATGDYLIIQDADLEYDPQDYVPMLEALVSGQADVIYGSRYLRRSFLRGKYRQQSWAAYLGGRSLSIVALACTGHYLTDTVTALKLFHGEALRALKLQTTGFELDHEITAKMLALKYRIAEVPVRYFPRSRRDGKKIGLGDWFTATRTFWAFRRG